MEYYIMFGNLFARLNRAGKILSTFSKMILYNYLIEVIVRRGSNKITSYGKGEKKLKLGREYYWPSFLAPPRPIPGFPNLSKPVHVPT